MTEPIDREAQRRAERAEQCRIQFELEDAERADREAAREEEEEEEVAALELASDLYAEKAALQSQLDKRAPEAEKGGALDRANKRTLGRWALGWTPATAAWFFAVYLADHHGAIDLNSNDAVGVFLVMLLPVLFWIPPVVHMERRRSELIRYLRQVQSRIDEIEERLVSLAPRVRSNSSSARQAQHAWYGDHSELNWRHREQGRALGFDNADDYVNNFLESD